MVLIAPSKWYSYLIQLTQSVVNKIIKMDPNTNYHCYICMDPKEVDADIVRENSSTEVDQKVKGINTISQEEVQEAKERMHRMHPLANVPIEVVIPGIGSCLKRCCCFRKMAIRQKKNKSLLRHEANNDYERLVRMKQSNHEQNKVAKQMDIEADEGAQENNQANETADSGDGSEENDPFNSLGFGIVAYLRMIKMMMYMFLFFSILMIPAVFIYSSNNGLEGLSNYFKARYSLGNIGFSGDFCRSMYLGVNKPQSFACKEGTIAKLNSYGVIPTDMSEKAYCGQSKLNTQTDTCSQYITNKAGFEADFGKCFGQQECITDIVFSKYLTITDPNNPCTNDASIFYMQFYCVQNNDDIVLKRRQALGVICIGIFISLTYILSIVYQEQTARLDYKVWDVDTVTVADFTVETNFTEGMWETFMLKQDAKNATSQQRMQMFEDLLRKTAENITTQETAVLATNEKEIRVSHITFAFDNVQMIKLLRQRGTFLTNAQMEKVAQVDEKIKILKEQRFDKITRPVAAFITFETQKVYQIQYAAFFVQEGYERGCNLKGKTNWREQLVSAKSSFLGEPFAMQEAPEPTNIIWENRDKTFSMKLKRQIIVICIIIILLLGAFFTFYILKRQTITNYRKYPPTTDCRAILKMFGGDNDPYSDPNFEKGAIADEQSTLNQQGTGLYQCFCKEYPGSFSKVPFCDSYRNDFYTGLALSQLVSFGIVAINFILRSVNIILIKYIGYNTVSKETQMIKMSIFVTQFFNTAILLLLGNANTNQTFLFWAPFNGEYPDLTFEWYNDVGSSLIITMLTAAFMPAIEYFMFLGMRLAFRILDKGFSCKSESTKAKTIQQYVNLYSGPEYMMHFKYAAMLNVIFVTFMYGLAVPLLFVFAFLFFAVSYIVERVTLAYSYRKPPMFDDVLNKSAIRVLKIAPLFMMFFGFWAMGNRQIFNNFVEGRELKTDPVITDHKGYEIIVDQTLPLFIVGVFIFVFLILSGLLVKILRKCNLAASDAEDEVDENLGTYHHCLGQKNRKAWLIEEMHIRKKFGAKTVCIFVFSVTDGFLEKLKDSKAHRKVIKATHNYEVTSSLQYADAFQYTPVELRDTKEEKENSDFVLRHLKLAYLPASDEGMISTSEAALNTHHSAKDGEN